MKNEASESQPKTAQPEQAEPVVAAAQTPATPTATGSKGLAIAAMVVGICSIVFGWVPFLGLILGIVAIVLGIIALKRKIGKGMSIAGIVTGALATIWNIIVSFAIIATILGIAAIGNNIITDSETIFGDYDTQIAATKDFAKGETAIFDNFEVTINSVQRNYIPDDSYYEAADGNELIVLNVSVTNKGDSFDGYISSYGFEVNDNGSTDTASYADVDNAFDGGSLSNDETSTGNLVFEVYKDATNLKLQYEDTVYSTTESDFVTLTYTLAF
jgi:hypothetical protein